MLFNSYEFIFLFLPITLLLFFIFGRRESHRIALGCLVAASLFFYGWWNPVYLGLIAVSILFNFTLGTIFRKQHKKAADGRGPSKWLLAFGIAVNLGLIGYFKYANFFIDNLNAVAATDFQLDPIILPLAISFFTFQQIAFLVDTYKGETAPHTFQRYTLFVTFFPQLIAGPIVLHTEMMPQFARKIIFKWNQKNFSVGVTIFFLGLFKKVILADGMAEFATPVFNAAEAGTVLTFFEGWCGALAYTFQLYFDFSGYSDMAIGLARMFNLRLPMNFNSPYKANNIVDFWRRWHISLSRFLRDYLYIPLGGNRKGPFRRYINLMITMLLGGLWHGAGWTFVVWGALHGFYLVINHVWSAVRGLFKPKARGPTLWGKGLARVVTFIAVVIAWVFFRSHTFHGAANMFKAMVGSNGLVLPECLAGRLGALEPWLIRHGIVYGDLFSNQVFNPAATGVIWLAALLLFVWYAPNTQQCLFNFKPTLEIYKGELEKWRWSYACWRPGIAWAAIMAIITLMAIDGLRQVQEFIYFQF